MSLEKVKVLGMELKLVQSEYCGTRHYKDEHGNRVILFPDGSFNVEMTRKEEKK